jgi:hypothetical protein
LKVGSSFERQPNYRARFLFITAKSTSHKRNPGTLATIQEVRNSFWGGLYPSVVTHI